MSSGSHQASQRIEGENKRKRETERVRERESGGRHVCVVLLRQPLGAFNYGTQRLEKEVEASSPLHCRLLYHQCRHYECPSSAHRCLKHPNALTARDLLDERRYQPPWTCDPSTATANTQRLCQHARSQYRHHRRHCHCDVATHLPPADVITCLTVVWTRWCLKISSICGYVGSDNINMVCC